MGTNSGEQVVLTSNEGVNSWSNIYALEYKVRLTLSCVKTVNKTTVPFARRIGQKEPNFREK